MGNPLKLKDYSLLIITIMAALGVFSLVSNKKNNDSHFSYEMESYTKWSEHNQFTCYGDAIRHIAIKFKPGLGRMPSYIDVVRFMSTQPIRLPIREVSKSLPDWGIIDLLDPLVMNGHSYKIIEFNDLIEAVYINYIFVNPNVSRKWRDSNLIRVGRTQFQMPTNPVIRHISKFDLRDTNIHYIDWSGYPLEIPMIITTHGIQIVKLTTIDQKIAMMIFNNGKQIICVGNCFRHYRCDGSQVQIGTSIRNYKGNPISKF